MLITPSTSIRQLRDAGIVPDWMYRDCDLHGMYEAENILCEWDWDWNWDLGDGYSKQQLEVLAEVRKTIREGIKTHESDPEAICKHKENSPAGFLISYLTILSPNPTHSGKSSANDNA